MAQFTESAMFQIRYQLLVDIILFKRQHSKHKSLPTLPSFSLSRQSLSGSEGLHNLLTFYSQGHSTQVTSNTFTYLQLFNYPSIPYLSFWHAALCTCQLPSPNPPKPSSSLAWIQHQLDWEASLDWSDRTLEDRGKTGSQHPHQPGHKCL